MKTVVCVGHEIIPSKIICIGRNYVEHVEELGNDIPDEMVIFMKPNSAISDELHSVHKEKLHYEGELSFLCKGGELSAVGFGLDLTKREMQNALIERGLPWERSKAFDGAALFSEFVEFQCDESALSLRLEIDGVIVQSAGTEQMIYKPSEIHKEVSRSFSLNDGDIIMTGTPKGVGVIHPGSKFEGFILSGDEVLTSAAWSAL